MWLQVVGLYSREMREWLQSDELSQLWRVRRKLIMREGIIYWAGDKKDRSKWRVV